MNERRDPECLAELAVSILQDIALEHRMDRERRELKPRPDTPSSLHETNEGRNK